MMADDRQQKITDKPDRRIERCQYAPEWAEHARNYFHDDPCDDGRQGVICGNRDDEPSCA
ncbi:MAG: hypothetical protein V2B19_10485 [Pseudomonadota bacterium]